MALKDGDFTRTCHAPTMCAGLFDLFAVGGLRLGCWHNAGAALCTETRILYCFPSFVLTNVPWYLPMRNPAYASKENPSCGRLD